MRGMSLHSNHRSREGQEAIERALAILMTPIGAGPPDEHFRTELAEVYGALALILDDSGRREEALPKYRRGCELGEALFRAHPEDPRAAHELVRSLGNMGIALSGTGRPAVALAAYQRAREVLQGLGNANPTLLLVPSASAWIELASADALIRLGRDAEALGALESARTARETLMKANPTVTRHPAQLVFVLRRIGDIQRRTGRTTEALASLERAEELAERLANAHPDEVGFQLDPAAVAVDLGNLLDAMGKSSEALATFDKAVACFDEVLAIRRKLFDADPSKSLNRTNLADTLRRRGSVNRRRGRVAQAEEDLRFSADLLGRLTSPGPGDLYNLACSLALLSGVADRPGSGLSTDAARGEADAAMAALRQAVNAGWRNASWARKDSDLDPIRSRPDFPLLILDLEFPVDPFAPRITRGGEVGPAGTSRCHPLAEAT